MKNKKTKFSKFYINKIREIVIEDPSFVSRYLEYIDVKKYNRCLHLSNRSLMFTSVCFNKVYKYQDKYTECSKCSNILGHAHAMFTFYEDEKGE